MILTRIFPGVSEAIDLEEPDSRERLAALYTADDSRWLRLNLITSVNGSAAGSDGTSESLTNRADRALLGVIRNQSDVVLVGAASVRAEGYRVPRRARLAILTASGELSGHRLSAEIEPGRLLVVCPESAAGRARETLGDVPADIVVLPDDRGTLRAAAVIDALAARGLTHVVCEGGPSLAAQLLDAGIVDEICLSTGPLLTSSRLALFGSIGITERRLELRQLLVDDASGLYARWTVRREEPAAGAATA